MANIGTKVIAGGAALLLFSTLAKAGNIIRLGDKLIIEKDFSIGSNAQGVLISIIPTLKNPTAEGLSLRHPFLRIKLREDGEAIATSEVKPTLYTLEPFSQLTLAPINVRLSPIDLVNIGIQVGKDLFKTKRLTVFVDTIVSITGESIPFDSTEKFDLKLPF